MLGSSVGTDALSIVLKHAPLHSLTTRIAVTRACRSLASYQLGDGTIGPHAPWSSLAKGSSRTVAAAFANSATHGRHSWAQPRESALQHIAAPLRCVGRNQLRQPATATVGAMVEQPLVVKARPSTVRELYMQLKLDYDAGKETSAGACNGVLQGMCWCGQQAWHDCPMW